MALKRIRTLDPSSTSQNSEQLAFRRVLKIFREAAVRVPAYADFLKKAGVKPNSIRTHADFAQVPETDKQNYFSSYSLKELSWDGTLTNARYISTSSGTTGLPFFWPRGEEQDDIIGSMVQRIYEYAYGASHGTTLFVNSFSLGTWIAGMEFFNAVRWVAEHDIRTTSITPGIDKFEAVREIQKLAPFFDRIIIAGYPPFVKDIIDHGTQSGIAWKDLDVKLLFAGESVVEPWRDRVLGLIGRAHEPERVVNIYGMAEAGVVGHETPVSIMARRNLDVLTKQGLVDDPDSVMGVYQYYPTARYFETNALSSLLVTSNSGMPLVRYSTRDEGGILPYHKVAPLLSGLTDAAAVALKRWKLPFVYLHGRKDHSLSLYALNVYAENVKLAFERSGHTQELSGMFTMSVGHDDNLDQRFDILVELNPETAPSPQLAETLARDVITTLKAVNSEYAKLYSVVGAKAEPHITLVHHGELGAVPGRKHRWVKRA